MIINKLAPALALPLTLLFLSACTTAPSNPIAADPVVIAKSNNSYEITVTGLTGKRSIDVERGFHEIADEACFTKSGWSGWKMSEGTQINPIKNDSGVYSAKGQIVCSK